MENRTDLKYYDKIKSLLPPEQFNIAKEELFHAGDESLEAFWNIIVAGYPVDFALENYTQLYDYLKDKPIKYTDALTTYVEYPGLKEGIYFTKTQWFELN